MTSPAPAGNASPAGGCRIRVVRAPCPLCGADRPETLQTGLRDVENRVEGSYDVSGCAACGMVYLSLKPDTASLAACYDTDYHVRADRARNPLVEALFSFRYRLRWNRLRRRFGRSPGSILEIGCGDGQFLAWLEKRLGGACRLTGTDIDTASIRLPAGSSISLVSGPLEEIYPGGTFDVILLYDVLEHLEKPVEALRRMAGWLAPGGILFLLMPDWESLWRRVFPRHWGGLQIPRHQVFFTRATLQESCRRAGLTVVGADGVFDPGDLGVSLCNWLVDTAGLAAKPRKAWFYYPVILGGSPLVLAQNLLGGSGQMEVTAVRG